MKFVFIVLLILNFCATVDAGMRFEKRLKHQDTSWAFYDAIVCLSNALCCVYDMYNFITY